MTPFSNTRTKRRTIYTVLLAWLFVLASGWANACLIQARDTHWHAPSDDATLSAEVPRVSPGHVGVDSDHAQNAGPGKGACLKVCDDGSQSLVKLASSVDLTDAAMAPPTALFWSDPLAAAARDNAWLALPAPGRAVPLRTRFARLTL